MDAPARSTALPPRVRAFLEAPRFASIATVDPDGGPRQAVVWYLVEDEELVINSADGRRWPANLRRDQRISLTVVDMSDGYNWVGLTGVVTAVIDDQAVAQADIAAMAHRYYPNEPAKADTDIRRFVTQQRVSFRIAVTGIHDHLEG
jgi:PPOX class probable F420-dependent enzyme